MPRTASCARMSLGVAIMQEVVRLTPSQVEQASVVLYRAFYDDPLVQ